jgi:DNA ligase (NAD+)
MEEKIRQRWESLVRAVEYHRHQYYDSDAPVISDAEYDHLYNELAALEKEFPELKKERSPTQSIGGEVGEGFQKVRHPVRVLSLANAFSREDLDAWQDRNTKILETVQQARFCVEPKMDGLTVVLHYREGAFYLGATRGDGEFGEDVTNNIRTIRGLPERLQYPADSGMLLPLYLVVRGEVYINIKDFESLNADRLRAGERVYVNPRNAAAGALRQLDHRKTEELPLRLCCYSILVWEGERKPETQEQTLSRLKAFGLPIVKEYITAADLPAAYAYCQYWANHRQEIPFEIDGVVIKIDDLRTADELGVVGKDPRGAIAYKFPAQEKMTRLIEIRANVGRTGVITPLAVLEPVEIGGVTIARATLHNFDYIRNNDIRIGDQVLVKRAGDVIPYIIGPVVATRTGTEKEYIVPSTCPSCGEPIARAAGEVAFYCDNASCPAQRVRLLEHFASRAAMNIGGLGIHIVEQLVTSHIVSNVADLYRLSAQDLISLEGFGEKKAGNIYQAIQQSKNRPMPNLIYALGIRGVGETTAGLLAKHFKTMESVARATQEELMEVDGVGETTAQCIVEWFHRESNKRLLQDLKKMNLWPSYQEETKLGNQPLKGLRFVVTGTLIHYSREEIKQFIKELGGGISERVTSKTNYLIMGDKPGSKQDDAQRLGIPILSEDELNKLIKKNNTRWP